MSDVAVVIIGETGPTRINVQEEKTVLGIGTVALSGGGGGGEPHPDTSTHDAMGLATDDELQAGLDTKANLGHNHTGIYEPSGTVASHDADSAAHGGIDAAAGTGSRRTLGTGALQAAPGNHAHAGTYDPAGTATAAVSTHNSDTAAHGGNDAAAGVASRRTLGTGATQAAAGNHAHSGVYDPAGTASSAVSTHNSDTTAHGGNDAAAGVASRRTLGTGATQAAAGNHTHSRQTNIVDSEIAAGAAIAESKLSLASDAAAGTASRRTIGTGALQAAAGNHAHAGVYDPAGTASSAVSTHNSDTAAHGGNDAAAGTASRRTLGTGATQAAAGNHGHTGTLDANARVAVKKAGAVVGTRRGINLIEGTNVTITVADDSANEEVDVTINASGSGGAATAIQDEGSALTQRSTLNFTGTLVAAADNAGSSRTDVTINRPTNIVDSEVSATAAIAESKLSLASDAAAGTASRRTIGTGALQAAAGNHAHAGVYEASGAVSTHNSDAASHGGNDAAAGTASRRTLGTGATQAAAGNHAHAGVYDPAGTASSAVSTHNSDAAAHGGADAAAGTASRRTLGTGALQAAAGNHVHAVPENHASRHASGGGDALSGNLDAVARTNVKKAGTTVGTRRGVNFIEGANVTITVADDSANEEVDVTIAAAAGGAGTNPTQRQRVSATIAQNSSTTYSNIFSGVALTAGTIYRIQAVILYTAAAATTAIRPSLVGPAMTDVTVVGQNQTGATASEMQHALAMATDLAFTASLGATVTKLIIDATVTPSASGTINLQFRSEVNNSAVTIQVGSYWLVEEVVAG